MTLSARSCILSTLGILLGSMLPGQPSASSPAPQRFVLETAPPRVARTETTRTQVGPNDFRISDMGTDGDASFDGFEPAVAHNSVANEYLVVWSGDDSTDGELEIYGQRLAADGSEIGADFRISDMGPDGDADYDAEDPHVTYNPAANEYLVVWKGDDNTGGQLEGETEIFIQRISAAGAEVGTNDFRISDLGGIGDTSFDADDPKVVYNPTADEYLVVWDGDDTTNGEEEVFGQRLTAAGAEVGPNDFRISDMGPDGDASFDADDPFVAYNPTANEYLVVWDADDNTAPLVEGEHEVFGQRLSAAGTEIGTNDFRISDMGPDGDALFDADDPFVAYNATTDEFMVAWDGDDDTGALVENEFEVFGQRLSSAGAEVGANDFRISAIGPDGNDDFFADDIGMAYNATANEFLVVWLGNTDVLVDDDWEIFGRRVAADGTPLGTSDLRISDMGPEGNVSLDAFQPAVIGNPTSNEWLVVWEGDDGTAPLVDEEFEVYGQRIGVPVPPAPAPREATITVVKQGTGSGRVTSDPPLIDCGPICTGRITASNTVSFFVTAEPGSTFAGFSGDPDCTDLVVEPTADRTCIATFDLNPTPTPAPTAPGAPVGLTASPIGNAVTFAFNGVPGLIGPVGWRDPATSYLVEIGSQPGHADLGIIPIGNVTRFTLSGPAGTYFAGVRGINGAGIGPRSTEVTFTLPCLAPPGVPGSLSASVSDHAVVLHWGASTSCGANAYLIEGAPLGATVPAAAIDTGSPLTTHVVPNVPSGTYMVRVSGSNRFGRSAASAPITIVVP